MHILGALLRAPALTGAIAPSSRYLAAAMAEASDGASSRIELGAGTGAVTRALVQLDATAPLTVVELQAEMTEQLKAQFPGARVLALPAAQVLREFEVTEPPCVLVSSLPFRSLPRSVRVETRDSILQFLEQHPGSWLVQFTYQPRVPFTVPAHFEWQRRATIIANLPPASVWVLRLRTPT